MTAKGVLFISMTEELTPNLKPVTLLKTILDDVKFKNKLLSKFCSRIYPIEYAIDASMENFERYARILIEDHLVEAQEGSTWAIRFKCRNNNKFKKYNFEELLEDFIPQKLIKIEYNSQYEFFIDITQVRYIFFNFYLACNVFGNFKSL